jgi:flavorubredoxin/flavin reductase (DIM6/NTAB) family NADH-FMN oxidoreductase RutF
MVVLTDPSQKRLTVQALDIAEETLTIRSLDWDRDRFDIEFGLQNGTTYNSFIIRGDKIALVDTSHEKFRNFYLDTLRQTVDPTRIDYLIISHTEPDHSGLVRDVLAIAPQATVVGSKVAIQFLEDLVHQPFERRLVKSGDTLDLGQGHRLEFISAPNLHWPDTLFTFDHKTQILYTCDAFGMHYCDENLFDVDFKKIEPDFRYYYDCLMGPNARSVLSALNRMEPLGTPKIIATGHGPLLRHNVTEWTERYRQWSQAKAKAETTVAVFYVSDYGFSDRLSQALAHGVTKTNVAVEMVDLKAVDAQEIQEIVGRVQGIAISMPPSEGVGADTAQASLSTILAAVHGKQVIGLFESYGGNDEPLDPFMSRFRELGLDPGFAPIRVKETPSEALYQLCEEAGTDLGQLLSRDRVTKQAATVDADLFKALGRISSGLYIITAKRGDVAGAMVASWVSQASFQPLGVTVAVAKDRAIESLMQVGDRFVLNVLQEGQHLLLMKHFLKRFPPGADRFAGVKTVAADNNAPILVDALAYLECEVASRMECSDHWIVYSSVQSGKVSTLEGLTAVHHRKMGSYY